MSDAAAALAWDRTQTPFGATVTETGYESTDLRFPGQIADAESGLSYNYFRDYDPSLGRYVESDPIGLMGGLNTYGYVGGNPLGYADSDGRQAAGGVLTAIGIDLSTPDPTDLALPKWAGWALALGGAVVYDMCTDESGKCPPCTPFSAGTIGYIGPHYDHDHYPIGSPHLNLFVVNQRPNDCKCFWNKNTPDAAAPPAHPDWVDLNGGFPELSP